MSESLQPASSAAIEKRSADVSLMPAEWNLAWDEFGRRYPRLKRGAMLVNAVVFNGVGLSVMAIISFIYGWFPWWAFALMLLSTLSLSQMFVIRFAGLAHTREKEELTAALTRRKVTFRIDEVSTRVFVQVPSAGLLTIVAKIKLQFENEDIYPWTMKGLHLTLHKLDTPTQDVFTFVLGEKYAHSVNKQEIPRDQFEGMLIQGGRVSPWYTCTISLVTMPSEKEVTKPGDLTGAHFLRLSMGASNQEPFTTDMFIDWDRAVTEFGAPVLSYGASALRIHENRRLGYLGF